MPDAAAEYGMMRTYLDWLIELPWALPEEKPIDIAEARRILDDDHFGLEKIKRRIIEYLAVRKLAPNGKAPILCFVGPPGVGKTSLGQSIARAMGRKFVRVSLGGVHDEAEIRGHRRTYIGALPGNIIQAIRKAGARDCVMMLDEIDKLGAGIQGDPASALLEVLDPEQNNTFRDNYLGVPFDLQPRGVHRHRQHARHHSGAAARPHGDHQPRRLHRRGEAADRPPLPGRRQLEANGLQGRARSRSPTTALRDIIQHYTREAGVRNLEREIGRVLRHAAVAHRRRAAAGRSAIARDDLVRDPRRAAVRERSRDAHQRARRRDRPRLDAGRRRHPVHRGDPHARRRQADPHRPARRRDEGERAGRAQPRQEPRRRARHRREPLREERHPHPRAGRRDPEGRAERRASPCSWRWSR